MKVYQAINAVQANLAKVGITKNRTNTQGSGYKFRGIDDIFNAISPLLAEHKLCVLPRVISRECVERVSKNGGALFYITVEAEFDFISAEDGSRHTVKTFGEAMDSGDKATNKAMSAAYKYAALQAFAIPTEGDNGDNDTENQTHEVSAPVINAQQAADLHALIEEVGVDTKGLFEWVSHNSNCKVTKVEQIPRMAHSHVVKMLEKKREQDKKAVPA